MVWRTTLSRVLSACAAIVLLLLPLSFARADSSGQTTPFPLPSDAHALHREDRDHISIIEFSGNYDKTLSNGDPNSGPRAVVAREFFRTHPDNYDFLVVFTSFEFPTPGALAFYNPVQNSIQGIGEQSFNLTSLYGSQGKLQGYIDMAALSRYATDPLDPQFEVPLSTIAHEMLHRWGSFVKFKLADGTVSDALLGKDNAHWSYLLDTDGSVQYGADWKDNGNGTFTSNAVRTFYSPLDLYLMGFYKPEEVPPFFLIQNPAIDKHQVNTENVTISGTKQPVTINDIVAAEGARVPAADKAQKEFRIGFVFLTGVNEAVSDQQIAALNNIRNAYMTRFAILTGGRGIAQVYPEAMPVEKEGTPTVVDGGAIRTTPSSVDEGLAWLRSRQTAEGFFADKDTTTVRDTTVATVTLAQLDGAFAGANSALQWLAGHPSTNTDYLARHSRLITDLNGNASAIRAQLVTLQNSDGGWGVAAGYQSDPLDTALALNALAGSTASQAAIDAGVQYLLTQQNTDGGWSTGPGAPSRTTITTTVLRALQSVGRQAGVAPTALAWLKTKQNSDGGFGDSPSTVHDTANALLTFMAFDAVQQIRVDDAASFILARQATSGSWDGSVYSTASAVSALKRFSYPNFTIPTFTADPTAPRDGDRVRFSVIIRNEGNVASQPTTVRLFDGDPAAGGVRVGADTAIPALAVGASVAVSPLWDSLNKAGPHTFYAIVEPDRTQIESSRQDNTKSVALTVQAAPAGIDLSFGAPEISISPAQPNRLPTTLAISVSVRNLGLTDAHNVPVSVWAGSPDTGTLVGQTTLDVLSRSTVVANFTYTLTKAGTTTFTAQVDPANTITEANKANNSATASITTAPSVDLSVTAPDITIDKNPAFVGDDITFTVKLSNLGTLDSPSTQVKYVITDGTTTHEIRTNTIQLNAGQTTTQAITWRVDLTGTLTFTAQLDPSGLVPEVDESNNIATRALSAGTPNGPNLTVNFQDFTVSPNPAHEGYPLTLNALIRNSGTTAALNAVIGFYNGDPASGGTLIGSTTIPSLAPGASTNATVTWSAVPDSQDKLLFVVADPANQIAEFAENDNAAFNVIPVLSLPDLQISSGDIQLSPQFPKTNENVTITARVSNLGAQSVTNVVVRAYDGDPAAGGAQIGGDQTIASISGFGTGTATFTWNSSTTSSRSLYVRIDPLNAILEKTKANNVARRDVAVQDGNFYVTNRYFSPDGDGQKDTTQLFFRLSAAANVSVQVVNKRQKAIRTFKNAAWANTNAGDVVWDGLDDLGRAVSDGTYRMRVVTNTGTNLGETSVEVDTNRSSLLEAVGTPYASYSNLTCELPNLDGDLNFTSDETSAFFAISAGRSPSATYALGVYRMASDGTDIRAIVPETAFTGNQNPYGEVEPSADGSKLSWLKYLGAGTTGGWVVDGDGKNPLQLVADLGYTQGRWMSADGRTAYYIRDTSLIAVNTTNGAQNTLFTLPQNSSLGSVELSPDHRKLALNTNSFDENDGYTNVLWFVDVATGASAHVDIGRSNYQRSFSWSPDGQKLAISDFGNGEIRVYSAQGTLMRQFSTPAPVPDGGYGGGYGGSTGEIGPAQWASTSSEFAFQAWSASFDGGYGYGGGYGEGYGGGYGTTINPGGVFVADLVTGSVDKAAGFDPNGCFSEGLCGGGGGGTSYHVSTWDGAKWVERGVLHYGMHYRPQTLDLKKYLPDGAGQYRVRVRQIGMEAAHVESIALLAGGREYAPSTALHLGTSKDITEEVSHDDYVVADVFSSEFEARWPKPDVTDGPVQIRLTAREETLSTRKAIPFTYPSDPQRYYEYRIDGDRALTIDGQQTNADHLSEPLFRELTVPNTGHPTETVYGYVQSDAQNLYGVLDFTVDNTMDGDKDWASLRVRTGNSWKEFKIHVSDTQYGAVGFIKTGVVYHPHKYYEFKIPLAEIGARVGDVVDVQFQAYGTAAILLDEPKDLTFGGDLYWVPGERTLLYYEGYWRQRPATAILLDDGNEQKQLWGDWAQRNFDIRRFSPTGRQLFFRSNVQALDPTSTCYRQGDTDQWAYRSLLNLTADLRAVRSAKAGGIQLKGTASDLNFSSYTLEYSTASAPNAWQPVAPASGEPLVDDLFTTWVPPAPGNYFVRLSVTDLAGNTRQTIKRVSWSDTPSITDVYRTPTYISPNGDGVNDVATIHYRVLEPVHLTFDFFDASGRRVRTIVRDHSTAGVDANLDWDGRDDTGLPVPDGKYRMTVQNYEFFVFVDATSPVMRLVPRSTYQPEVPTPGAEAIAAYEPSLQWDATDDNLATTLIETGEGADPTNWSDFSHGFSPCATPDASTQHDPPCLATDISSYTDHRFRFTATDKAGNKVVKISPVADQELIALEFGNHIQVTPESLGLSPSDAPNPLFKYLTNLRYVPMSDLNGGPPSRAPYRVAKATVRFTLAETIRKPVSQISVQYHLVDVDPPVTGWTESSPLAKYFVPASSPVPEVMGLQESADIPNELIQTTWDLAGIEAGKTYVARLHAVDSEGNSYYSNTFRFVTEGLVPHGLYSQSKPDADVERLMKADTRPGQIVWGEQFVGEPLQSVKLFVKTVKSDDDPRYAVFTPVDEVNYPERVFIYKADLRSCTKYTSYLLAKTEPKPDPVTGKPISRTLQSGEVPLETPCLKMKVKVEPVPTEACDAPSKNQLRIRFATSSLDGQQLKLLKLWRKLPNDGGEDVVFNVNKPRSVKIPDEPQEPEYPYEFILDTSNLPETPANQSGLEYTVSLINVADKSEERPLTILIDHTPPNVRYTYPTEGLKVCGVPFVYKGENHSAVTVEGEITDRGGFDYKLLATDSRNATTTEHDTLGQNSFVFPPTFPDPLPKPYRNHSAVGPLGKLYDKNGRLTLKLEVDDWGGFKRCESREVIVDGIVEGAVARLDNSVFSPNGDGAFDEVTATYSVDEAATLNVNVFHATNDGKGNVTLVGDSIRTLAFNQQILEGESSIAWDGRNGSGSVVEDGQYAVVIAFKDSCGNLKEFRLPTEVDNTPPAISIAYPHTPDQLPMLVEIQGTVTDPNLQGWGADYGVGSLPDAWVRVGKGAASVPSIDVLGKWNTFGLDGGAYAVRVIANDRVGNTREVIVPVTLTTRANLISYLDVVPDLFSPNGDGRRESTSIRYELEQDGLVTLTILDRGGAVRRTLSSSQQIKKGPAALPWDGKDDSGVVLPDGNYSVALLVAAQSNPLLRQEEKATVVIDATPPLIDITRPKNGFVQGTGGVLGSISDLHISDYVLSFTDTPSAPNWQVLADGTDNRTNALLTALPTEDEGEYAIKVEAKDLAENQSSKIIPFIVDKTPPKVTLSAPTAGAFVGVKTNPVNITGSIEEKYINTWRLRFGAGAAPDAWTDLANGTTLPLPAVINAWDVSHLPDGTYTVSLIAEDKAGNTGEAHVTVTVDNTPPTATIVQPTELSYVTKVVDIRGTATDTNFADYKLEIAPGEKGQSSRWSEIATGTTAVDNGVLLNWEAFPSDGVHTLKLTVHDKAQNVSEALLQVTVDTHPPAPPINLTGTLQNVRDGHLTWTANTEPDLAGYAVYRGGERLNQTLITSTSYTDPNLIDGRYVYVVKAFDKAGWESQASNEVTLIVDVSPPTVRISLPTTSSVVSGLVDVKGTAYSTDDFKEYRLYVGDGSAPTDFQLLRRSPVPVLNDLLAQWNTLVLAEGAQFTIKLEADDINGNTGTDRVTVTVDNRPPAAPTGLTAVPSGSNVTLHWNPNTEPDLLGYLLFRNEHLANQQGVLVGSLKPYAVVGVNYNDLSLPDGPYTYYLLAIDKAGNTSDPSNTAQVSLDNRAPHATIVQPATGAVFDKQLYVLATSPDTDIARVQFQYRAVGTTPWSNVQPADTGLPYEASFDPAGLHLPYGNYQLQAVATDQTNHTDPAPTPITVTYKDLTPPAVAVGVMTHVDGGTATVTWTANTESDIAGYYVDRTNAIGTTVRLTASPVTATTYTDSNLDDTTYQYQVIAVDSSQNQAAASAMAAAVVYTPVIQQPYSPTKSLATTISGKGVTASTISGGIVNGSVATPLPSQATDANGAFSLANVALGAGSNVITVRLSDSATNVSKPAQVWVDVGSAPSKPTGVAAVVNGYNVSLSWNANQETNIAGYRLFDKGQTVLPDQPMLDLSVTGASSTLNGAPVYVIDGNLYRGWGPLLDSDDPHKPQWIALSWPQPRLVSGLSIAMDAAEKVGVDIEAWTGHAWLRVAQLERKGYLTQVELPQPYMTDQIRLVARDLGPDSLLESVFVGEIGVLYHPLQTMRSYTEETTDGVHKYSVTAVNNYGFESAPSDAADTPVGDTQPPEPVTLTATVAQSDVTLTWTASTSTDVTHYALYRDGQLITTQSDLSHLSYIDVGRPNGTYVYVVRAFDAANNESPPSNEASATVAIIPPPAPVNLVVSVVPAGRALDLTWSPADGSVPVAYRIYRGLSSGQVQQLITETPDTQYRDQGLTNGTTYYYVVKAVDAVQNGSVSSNEAYGTPLDTAPPVVGIHYPTVPGRLLTTIQRTTRLVARTEAGSHVRITRNGVDVAQADALASSAVKSANVEDDANSTVALSPDGKLGVYISYNSKLKLIDIENGTTIQLLAMQTSTEEMPSWSPDGSEIYFLDADPNTFNTVVRAIKVTDRSVRTLTSPTQAYNFALAGPDGRLLTIDVNGNWWLMTPTAGTRQYLGSDDSVYTWTIVWSPDSSRIAYVRSDSVNEVDVLHVATGSRTAVATGVDNALPSWAPDGSALIYQRSDANALAQVYRYSFADASTVQLTTDQNWHTNALYAPDGSAIIYRTPTAGDDVLVIQDLTTDDVEQLDTPVIWPQVWTRDGYLTGWGNDGWSRISPRGRVELPGVSLVNGDNLFAMQATDLAGNTGPLSAPIDVNYRAQDRADLSVVDADVRAFPVAPKVGEPTRINVTVRNIGTASSPAAGASVMLVSEQGVTKTLVSGTALHALIGGASQTLSIDWTPTQSGTYQIVAIVDPNDDLVEASESNNLAVREVPVIGNDGQRMSAQTDRLTYAPAEQVQTTVTATNYDETFDGRLVVAIEDQQGYLVTNLFDQPIAGLPFNQSQVENLTWPTGATFAGGYQVHGRLFSSGGQLVAEASAPFAIESSSNVTGLVATDKSVYLANNNVRVTGNYEHSQGNTPISAVNAKLTLIDANDQVLAETQQALGDLLPGANGALTLDWNTGTYAVGSYRATLTLTSSAQVLATSQSSFRIEAGSTQLNGTLALSDQAPAPGTPQIASYSVSNVGNAGANQLPIRISLLDPGSPVPIDTRAFTADVGVGGSTSGSVLFDTAGLALKTYTVALQADIPAGSQTQTVTLATTSFHVVDRVPPQVDVRSPAEAAFIRGNAAAQIYARDLHSSVKRVEASIDGGAFAAVASGDASQNLYALPLGGLSEGPHQIAARATDAYDNVGTSNVRHFVVDNTPPVVTVQGVTDGGLYNRDITPVVTVTDANLDKVTMLLDAAPFVSGMTVTANGTHRLVITALDKAGNGTVKSVAFTIDRAGPQITITGVTDGGIYNTDVVPVITVTDTKPVTTTITLNGQPFVSGTAVTASGTYTLAVSAVDTANNTASAGLQFTIDKDAPTVVITSPVEGAQLKTRATDVRGTTEPQATVYLTVGTFQVNTVANAQGQFLFSQVPLVEGANRIQAYAKDRSGNTGPTVAVNVRVTTATQAQLDGRITGHGSVLVYMPSTHETHDCHVGGYGGRHDDARSSPPAAHDRYAALVALVEGTLIREGDDYLIVRNEDDFLTALRSRRYSTLMLAELQPSGSGGYYGYGGGGYGGGDDDDDDSTLHLSSQTMLELKGSVAAGSGLVWIKTHPDNNEHLQSLFGAKSNGLLPNITQLVLPNSVASVAGTWSIQGPAMKVKLMGGTAVGQLKPVAQPAMVISQYGDGRTALMAFDPSLMANTQGAMDTLTNVLAYAKPMNAETQLGSFVQLEWTASHVSPPLNALLKSQVAAGFAFVSVNGGTATVPSEAVWSRSVTTDTSVFAALVRLPQTKGSYSIAAQLKDAGAAGTPQLAQATVSVAISKSRDDLGAAALTALRNLKVPNNQKASVQRAIDYVQSAVSRSQRSKSDALYSIGKTTLALDQLLQCNTVPNDAVVAVAELMGAYESLWSSYP